MSRFLFGGDGPDEFADDATPSAPIPDLVERLQRYSGQETIPPPPGIQPAEPVDDTPEQDDEIPLVIDEERPAGGSRSHS